MSWSAAQARMLEAMGYEPMHRWSGPVGPTAAAVAEAPAAGGSPARSAAPAHASAPSPARRVAPPMDAPGPAPRAAGDLAALASALRRAAGGRDVDGLVGDLERLRRDPALKRALWPRLRALRRPQ